MTNPLPDFAIAQAFREQSDGDGADKYMRWKYLRKRIMDRARELASQQNGGARGGRRDDHECEQDIDSDRPCPQCVALREQLSATHQPGAVSDVRSVVIATLQRHTKDMEKYSYYSANLGVSEDDYEEVADEITAALQGATR